MVVNLHSSKLNTYTTIIDLSTLGIMYCLPFLGIGHLQLISYFFFVPTVVTAHFY